MDKSNKNKLNEQNKPIIEASNFKSMSENQSIKLSKTEIKIILKLAVKELVSNIEKDMKSISQLVINSHGYAKDRLMDQLEIKYATLKEVRKLNELGVLK